LRALYAFQGKMVSQRQLALDAIHVEQNMIQENVGSQDQIAAAFGGFNYIEFSGEDNFRVEPITISYERLAALEDRLMLFYTGLARFASEIAAEQISNIPKRKGELSSIRQIVEEARKVLLNNWEPRAFGELLHEAWELKKSLSSRISSPEIDEMYARARAAGAVGGKLLGAGGGGFVLLYVEPEDQSRVREGLREYLNVPFRFENLGSQVVFYQPYFSRRDESGRAVKT
jgi:D-glycero-alpha-D-manno-heptose-7-phosphate kinase